MKSSEMPAVHHKPGDRLHGFHVDAVTPLPEMRMVAYELTHTGSGARLVHLHGNDRENLFAIVLRTPPPDDTGLPHILEHTVLCGSKRFPVKDPFVELLKTSLATFLNAFTGPDHTAYPCASMNEKDFFNLVEVYCDAVFNPRITREHFKQEGHHLSFEEPGDTTSPLTLNGIVYNEMKGAFSSLHGVIWRELGRNLFPDNAYGRESGGDPVHIPSLTYEQFAEFHRTYYHPSNAQMVVYGDIPTAKHLAFLDSKYLGAAKARTVDTAIAPQPRWDKPRRTSAPYAIGPEESPARKAAVTISFMTNQVTDVMTDMAMHILEYYLLGNAASPLRKALIDSRLGDELTPSGYCGHQRDTYFTIGLKGTEPERTDAIAALVRSTLETIARTGLDCDKLESAFHQYELAAREQVVSSPLHYLVLVQKGWLYDMSPVLHLKLDEHLAALRRHWEQDGDYFEGLVKTWFLDNPHYSVITFVPDADMTARMARELQAAMREKKEAMNEQALRSIAEEAAALDELQATPNSAEALATLPHLALSDVPRQPIELPTESADVSGIPVLVTDLFSNGVNHVECAFNLAGIPDDLIDCLGVFADALCKMGAAGKSYIEMAEREAACSGGIYAYFTFEGRVDDPLRVQPMLVVGGSAVDRKLDDMLSLLASRMLSTDFSDTKRLQEVLLQRRVQLRNTLVANSSSYARRRAIRRHSQNAAIQERILGVHSVNVAERQADRFDADADTLRAAFGRIQAFMASRGRLTLSFVGPAGPQGQLSRWLADLVSTMRPETVQVERGVPSPSSRVREALAIPSPVASVAMALTMPHVRPEDMPVLFMLSSQLTYGYLWDEVRVKGGAYGVHASFEMSNGRFVLSSSQDPNVKETLDVFGAVAGYVLGGMDLSAHGIEQALIGSFKKMDYPIRGGEACSTALTRHMTGLTQSFRSAFRERLFGLAAADIRRVAADLLVPGLREADVCAMASREKLEAENEQLGSRLLPVMDTADAVA